MKCIKLTESNLFICQKYPFALLPYEFTGQDPLTLCSTMQALAFIRLLLCFTEIIIILYQTFPFTYLNMAFLFFCHGQSVLFRALSCSCCSIHFTHMIFIVLLSKMIIASNFAVPLSPDFTTSLLFFFFAKIVNESIKRQCFQNQCQWGFASDKSSSQ